jgi:succinyl-diaminopimelate desuccinylase
MILTDPLPLARALLRCPSVTPEDGGAQDLLATALETLGFGVTRLPFGTTPNLFARVGAGRPHVCFAGHTDVVPPGPGWRFDPFGAVVADGVLYGRGACDMKGAVAAFVAACARHLEAGAPRGSIGLLITGDEEGPATDGTVRVLEWLEAQGQVPDCCIVGEPTNPVAIGDMVKVGRRGSLNAVITVRGVMGHVAYPHRASNPVHPLVALLGELSQATLDDGTARFEPSSLQVTSIDVGNPAANVIPGAARARLNIRFNDRHTGASLAAWLRAAAARHAPGAEVEVAVSGEAFLAPPAFGERLAAVVARVTGRAPALDTGGGTSDARFIARLAPVAEFGLVGASMHKADERVAVADLRLLADIYAAMLQDLLP